MDRTTLDTVAAIGSNERDVDAIHAGPAHQPDRRLSSAPLSTHPPNKHLRCKQVTLSTKQC